MEDNKDLFLAKSKELDTILEKATKLKIEYMQLSSESDVDEKLKEIENELDQLQNRAVRLFRNP